MQSGSGGPEIDRLLSAEPDELERREGTLAVQFERNPGLAELLLPALASGSTARVANARRLLSLFNEEALLTVARGFEIDDATARFEILGVLWAIIVAAPPREWPLMLDSVAPYLKPGLEDRRRPERGFADPERLELEHDYRICDEVYLFLNRLRSADFDDSYFEVLEDDRKDAEVSQFGRRMDNLLGSPVVAAQKAAGKAAALAEITIVANFPDAYATASTQEERDKAAGGTKWAPARRDFLAVAAVDTPQPTRAIFEVSSFLEALSVIMFVNPAKPDSSAFRPGQSVKRVNIISHGNSSMIAMSGTVDTEGVVMLNMRAAGASLLSGPIDIAAVQAASDPLLQLANGKALTVSLRDRLAPDAEIFLIACDSGMGQAVMLMQDLKALFKVKIRAFSQAIAYCPLLDANKIIDRAFTAVGSCSGGSKRGFHHLAPDRTF
jgi:hypothetical protein